MRESRRARAPSDFSRPYLSPCHEGQSLEQMHVLFVLEQRAMQRWDELLRIALAQSLGSDVFRHQQLQPVEKLGGGRLFLHSRHFADFVEQSQSFCDKPLFDIGKMHLNDCPHSVGVGKADVVKEASAQECVRQFFLVI